MQKKTHTGLHFSGTITQFRQVLSHLKIASTTDQNPTCQVCCEPIEEGDQITLYLSKPAGKAEYTIGQCRCRNHDDKLTSLLTLGVEELVVDGRVGQCSDHATQQKWPILLAPSIRLLSSADTKSGRLITSCHQRNSDIKLQSENAEFETEDSDPIGESQSELSVADEPTTAASANMQSTGGDGNGR